MEIAKSPGKQLLMTGFMLWMSGSSLQIFSIMMVAHSLFQPMQKIYTTGQAFSKYSQSNVDLIGPKIIYIALNFLGVCVALYKCQTLGLLPTSALDWMPAVVIRQPLEYSVGSNTFIE